MTKIFSYRMIIMHPIFIIVNATLQKSNKILKYQHYVFLYIPKIDF